MYLLKKIFWKVYNLADEQDQIMLLAFFHLGARRNELFGLEWSNVDFARKQVYLQTRKRDGGLEGDWIPMTEQLSQGLMEWLKKRQSMLGVDQDYVFICLSIKHCLLYRFFWKAVSETAPIS